MLTPSQLKFRANFLHPIKQRFYFWRQLPMAGLAGVTLLVLDEEKSIATVPFKNRNKNPFKSTYFAVLSMAAELSTAAHAMLALKGLNANIALIITDLRADFVKKAQTKITFTSTDYQLFTDALATLKTPEDAVTVTAKSLGTNQAGDLVAVFYFTWSFKRRS